MYIPSNVQQVSQLCTSGSHNDYRIELAHITCKVALKVNVSFNTK